VKWERRKFRENKKPLVRGKPVKKRRKNLPMESTEWGGRREEEGCGEMAGKRPGDRGLG